MNSFLRPWAVLALTVFALAACGEEAALPTDLSTADAIEDIGLTEAAFEVPATESLEELGYSIDAALLSAGGGSTLASIVAAGPRPSLRAAGALEGVEPATVAPVSALPEAALGKTFEWDVATGAYVASDRAGAPSNGVQFILYQLNGDTGEPAEPLVEVGSAIVTQGGTVNTPSATLTVRNAADVVVLSYTATRGGTASIPSFTVAGTAGTGPNAVTFSLTAGVNVISQNVTAVWRTEIAARSLVTRTTLGINRNTGAITLAGLMQRGLRRIDIRGTIENTGGELTVDVGRKRFATIVLNGIGSVTITNASGEPLTPEEEETLERIFRWFESSLSWYDTLLYPVYVALGIFE